MPKLQSSVTVWLYYRECCDACMQPGGRCHEYDLRWPRKQVPLYARIRSLCSCHCHVTVCARPQEPWPSRSKSGPKALITPGHEVCAGKSPKVPLTFPLRERSEGKSSPGRPPLQTDTSTPTACPARTLIRMAWRPCRKPSEAGICHFILFERGPDSGASSTA